MHGRLKTRTTEEQKEIAKQEKYKKAKAFRDAMKVVWQKRAASVCDQDVLNLTASLLTCNPDITTLWNYRREIFLQLKNREKAEGYQKMLENDLVLTENCLRINPKSYGSWHHRVWILENLPKPDWEKEVKLCTKYLELDERNFHCWDYRRIVTEKAKVPDESEYKYTLEKIETNFSNYSAWHLRSKLLPRIFPDPEGRFPIEEKKHKEELALVENAAFTDPNDQSAWFYLRWLLGMTEPKVTLVSADASEIEVGVVTSKIVKLSNELKLGVQVRVRVNGDAAKGVWLSETAPSCAWSFKFESKIEPTDSILLILEENGVEYDSTPLKPNTVIRKAPNFYPVVSDGLKETLISQLSSCDQLMELEPDSKWTLLTKLHLMLSINSSEYESEITEGLDRLIQIDPLREGYYLDMRSKILVQFALNSSFNKSKTITLKNKKLTAFYHRQYFIDFEEVDLSENNLTSQSLSNLHTLFNCKVLNLSNNKFDSLNSFPVLPKLETLVLDNNMIHKIDKEWIEKFPQLKNLSILNNPVLEKGDFIKELSSRLAHINISFEE